MAMTTSEKIAAKARKLLASGGAEAVTMRKVAAGVGITPMAVYRHFADRDALLTALADEGFAELAGRVALVKPTGKLATRLTHFLDINLDFALEKPRLFELMFLSRREGSRKFPTDFKAGKSPTASPMADLVQEGMETGYFRPNDVWEIVFETGALLQGLVMLYLGGRVDMSETQFRAFCHRSLQRYMHGIQK
ncbi:MAG TPA: TetR/AcrR family transcriptional regulator [Acidobacteriaceae bacterium]|jgi:AcrR family transcriptional regulator